MADFHEDRQQQSWHQPTTSGSLPTDQTAGLQAKVSAAQLLATCACVQ